MEPNEFFDKNGNCKNKEKLSHYCSEHKMLSPYDWAEDHSLHIYYKKCRYRFDKERLKWVEAYSVTKCKR